MLTFLSSLKYFFQHGDPRSGLLDAMKISVNSFLDMILPFHI